MRLRWDDDLGLVKDPESEVVDIILTVPASKADQVIEAIGWAMQELEGSEQ